MHTNILQYHCLQSCKQCNIGKHLSTSIPTKHLKEKKCFYTIFQRQKWITFSKLSFFSSDTISKILKYKNTEIMNYLLEKLLKLSNSVAAGCHEFTDTYDRTTDSVLYLNISIWLTLMVDSPALLTKLQQERACYGTGSEAVIPYVNADTQYTYSTLFAFFFFFSSANS